MADLPISDHTHDQERRSSLAFACAVPEDLFLVREENGGDYGIDRILEVRMNKKEVTNLRSHVQLKSVENGKRLEDGSLSYPVPIKTLNYLLNQPNSLFVVYVENEKCLMWAWAFDIQRYASAREIDVSGTTQDTLSYHFTQRLDSEAFRFIHDRIIRNGEVVRHLSELIATTLPGEALTATIDLTQGRVSTPQENIQLLRTAGMWLTNAGRHGDIRLLLEGIPVTAKSDPELGVVVAYAKFHAGEYLEALSWLPRGGNRATISPEEQPLVEHLEAALSFLVGLTSEDDYRGRISEIETRFPETTAALWSKMQRQREELMRADRTLTDEFKAQVAGIQQTFSVLRASSAGSPAVQAWVELAEWQLEGIYLLQELLDDHFEISAREKLGLPIQTDARVDMARDYLRRRFDWSSRFDRMDAAGWPSHSIAAIAYVTRAALELQFIANSRILSTNAGAGETEKQILNGIRSGVETACSTLLGEHYWREGLRAKLLIAEIEFGLDHESVAATIAQEVQDSATAFGVVDVIALAEKFLSGQRIFGIKEYLAARLAAEDFGEPGDDEVSKYARQFAKLMGLPPDRLPNIEADYRWTREDAKERRVFCQHVHVLQDLRHSCSTDTMYASNPDRIYVCRLKGIESYRRGTDRDALLALFKATVCLGCPDRQPASSR